MSADQNPLADAPLEAQLSDGESPFPATALQKEEQPLPPRRAAFVAEYLKDFNATQAAIRAGYSARTAQEISHDLLSNALVADAVARGKAQRLERVNVTADKVLQEMALLAESDVSHYIIDDYGQVELAEGAPDGAMRAIQSIKRRVRVLEDGTKEYNVELKLWDKPTPLRLLGRHVGIFTDKLEVTGKGGGPIQVAAAQLADMTQEQLAEMAQQLASAAKELTA